ncbi:hypothetical protein JM83_1182 [Gillisia sp. Hel_I_86]|uniref:hypothetical protein n=1 Tax=Gillisia sp. Hel_I_86 TaxID=1249981 RepID=UPI00119B755E|nr:hypothetical protein [Gillisia sp. Hel_I_86]TVZ26228.1 hypothetical protein JM83_1182 [Gillisia sp. Hel_I_86]
MLKTAKILVFIFVSFLTVPTIAVLIDNNTDISFVFSNTEEEQAKNNISIEFVFNETRANHLNIELLPKKSLIMDKERHDLQSLYPEVISPPPELA